MKKIYLGSVLCLLISDTYSQFNYLETLQKYWNYRYHLVGDRTIKDQYMPWINDYRHKLGEPGMLVPGTAAGHSIPSTGISLFNLWPYQQDNFDDPSTPWSEYWLTRNACIDMNANLPTSYNQSSHQWEIKKYETFAEAQTRREDVSCYNQIEDHIADLEDKGGIVSFDQQTPNHLAEYISVLATEWKLLTRNGFNTFYTEIELHDALFALERMDLFSETKFSSEAHGENGFFYRDDVPWDLALGDNFGPNELVRSQASCDYWVDKCDPAGHHYPNADGMMSQDNAEYVLNALAFVVVMLDDRFASTASIRQKAKNIAERICYWVRDSVHNPQGVSTGAWAVATPDNKLVCRGPLAYIYSYEIAKATRRIMEHPNPNAYQNGVSSHFGLQMWRWYWKPTANFYNPNVGFASTSVAGNFAKLMAVSIAGDIWGNGTGPGRVASRLHNMSTTSPDGEPGLHYDLMNAVLNGKSNFKSQSFYENILARYECYSWPRVGTYSVDANNELGFMFLFNLYCLKFGVPNFIDLSNPNSVNYADLRDRIISSTFPFTAGQSTVGTQNPNIEVQAANTLIGLAHLLPTARVDFVAPHITLMQGFYAEYGSVSLIQNGRMECNAHEFPLLPTIAAAKTDETLNDENDLEDEDEDELPANLEEVINSGIPEILDETERYEFIKYWTDYFKEHGEGVSMNTVTSVNSEESNNERYDLIAFPNPFANSCTVSVSLPKGEYASITLTDMLGSNKLVLHNGYTEAGVHEYKIERENLAAGVYVLRYYDNNGHSITRQLTIN